MGGVVQPWLSDHEVLHFRKGVLYRYDATTKADTPLTQLTRQMKASHCYLYFLEASPDGRQVMWGRSANNPLFVATVDGARREQWPSDGGMTEPFWCMDGKHWMQFFFGGTGASDVHWTKAQVHNLDAPHSSETFGSFPPSLKGLDVLAAPSADRIVARTRDAVKFLPPKPRNGTKHADGSVSFSMREIVTNRAVQTLSVWSLRQPTPLHEWTVKLPGKVQEVSVSPDGERAAWLLMPTMPKTHPRGPVAYASLWVSGLDGTGLHKVGDFTVTRRAARKGIGFPSQVLWVPGGKRLSFVYRDSLWTVPVE